MTAAKKSAYALKQELAMEANKDKKMKESTQTHVRKIQPNKNGSQTNDPGCRPIGT